MRIALIYPSKHPDPAFSTLVAQENNMGIFPPLSLAYVASAIEKSGHEAIIIDANALKLNVEMILRKIGEYSPDILGFSITTYTFYEILGLIGYLRKKTGIPVIVGGKQHLEFFPMETMQHNEIDFALQGDADINLADFLRQYEGEKEFKNVPGLCFRENGKVIINKLPADDRDIDDIPFPARHLLPNAVYYSIISQRKNFTAMLTGRGCTFRCKYCTQHGKLRLRSAMNVLSEIEKCYHEHDIREFDIYDTEFTVNKKRVYEICAGIKSRKLDIRWTLRTRLDLVDRDLLFEMKSAGCGLIMYGIESYSLDLLAALNRKTDPENNSRALYWTREAGILSLGFFMIGLPGETNASAENTIKYANSLALDFVQFTKMSAFPGTEIYRQYVEQSGNDYWRNYIIEQAGAGELQLVGTDMTHQEAKQYIRKAYISFYLRPGYLLRMVFVKGVIKHWAVYARAFFDIFFQRPD